MIIEVDLTGDAPHIALADPDDCGRFHVTAAGGDAAALDVALMKARVGRVVASGDALIETSAVVELAQGRVGADWSEKFDGMLAYAKSKGWPDETGSAIQAHVEWLP